FLTRRLEILAMLDQLGAEGAHRAVLLDRIAARHIDHRRHAMTVCGERKTLAVVTARGGNDAGHIRLLALQPLQINETAADLEGADRRVVLMLDHDMRAEPF